MPRHSNDKARWTWPTIITVALIILLAAGSVVAFVGVTGGWIEPPPDPEGTYPDAAGHSAY